MEFKNKNRLVAFTLAEGATHVGSFTKKRLIAFTLAEVLITLTVIGVVAAITMPTLVQQKNNNEIKARVKKAYSTLSNAVELAKADNGDIESWGWASSSEGCERILDIIAPHLNIKEKCGTEDGCFPNVVYKLLRGGNNANYSTNTDYAKARLSDGSSLAIYSNSHCYGTNDVRNDICGSINIDVNGDAAPNKWGHDMFGFNITKEGVVPYKNKANCINTLSLGYSCAANIIYDDSVEYLTTEPIGPIGYCNSGQGPCSPSNPCPTGYYCSY